MKRRIWHLALAAVLGAVVGSASMATYLYVFQAKVEDNAAQLQRQERRIERLEKRPVPKPGLKRPTYTPPKKRHWWEVWRR